MSFPTFTNSGFPSFGTNPFNPVLGPPKGLFSNNPIGTPRGSGFPKPFVIVRPFIATSLINAMPKTNDGLMATPRPNISFPPMSNDIDAIPINSANVLTNPIQNLTGVKPIVKNPNDIKLSSFSTTVTDELGAPIANANLYLDNIAVGLTDAKGYVSKIGFNPLSRVKISFVGFQPFEGLASQVPAKVILKTGIALDGVTIKNSKSKKTPWLMIILGAVVAYGGYKYFFDKKSNSVVKVKL